MTRYRVVVHAEYPWFETTQDDLLGEPVSEGVAIAFGTSWARKFPEDIVMLVEYDGIMK